MFEDSDLFNLIILPDIIDEDEENEDIDNDYSDSDTPIRKRRSSGECFEFPEEND